MTYTQKILCKKNYCKRFVAQQESSDLHTEFSYIGTYLLLKNLTA